MGRPKKVVEEKKEATKKVEVPKANLPPITPLTEPPAGKCRVIFYSEDGRRHSKVYSKEGTGLQYAQDFAKKELGVTELPKSLKSEKGHVELMGVSVADFLNYVPPVSANKVEKVEAFRIKEECRSQMKEMEDKQISKIAKALGVDISRYDELENDGLRRMNTANVIVGAISSGLRRGKLSTDQIASFGFTF